MDPNICLERIRSLIREWERTEDTGDASAILTELAEAVGSLDEWLIGGGFLPTAWATR